MNKRLDDLINLLDIERIEVNLLDGKEFLEDKLLAKHLLLLAELLKTELAILFMHIF